MDQNDVIAWLRTANPPAKNRSLSTNKGIKRKTEITDDVKNKNLKVKRKDSKLNLKAKPTTPIASKSANILHKKNIERNLIQNSTLSVPKWGSLLKKKKLSVDDKIVQECSNILFSSFETAETLQVNFFRKLQSCLNKSPTELKCHKVTARVLKKVTVKCKKHNRVNQQKADTLLVIQKLLKCDDTMKLKFWQRNTKNSNFSPPLDCPVALGCKKIQVLDYNSLTEKISENKNLKENKVKKYLKFSDFVCHLHKAKKTYCEKQLYKQYDNAPKELKRQEALKIMAEVLED